MEVQATVTGIPYSRYQQQARRSSYSKGELSPVHKNWRTRNPGVSRPNRGIGSISKYSKGMPALVKTCTASMTRSRGVQDRGRGKGRGGRRLGLNVYPTTSRKVESSSHLLFNGVCVLGKVRDPF